MTGAEPDEPALRFMMGGGAAGAAARAVDWSKTPLGPVDGWPGSLRTAVGLVLHSHHPMLLLWGPELIQFYNDAYMPTFPDGKHPAAMGQEARTCWSDVWHRMEPQVHEVFREGRSSWHEDRLAQAARHGRMEEAYWTYSYSPVLDELGGVVGALVVCFETTNRVLGGRRGRMLTLLAERLAASATDSDVVHAVLDSLSTCPADVPYAARFLVDAEGRVKLTHVTPPGAPLGAELEVALTPHLRAALAHGHKIDHVSHAPLTLENGVWPEAIKESALLEVGTNRGDRAREFLALGVSPRLCFDACYRDHFAHVHGQLEQARTRVEALEIETAVVNERRSLMLQAPVAMAILRGSEHVCELANAACIRMLNGRHIEGKRFFEAFPELADGNLRAILDDAYGKGTPFVAAEFHAPLDRGRGMEDAWFKFSLEPLRTQRGDVYGLMAVAVDISEVVASRRSLEKLYHEREYLLRDLEAAHRAKDEFLAMLGHELRNPLAPIITALHVMRMKESEGLGREREIIERQARHLVRLVDDLLDIARITRGKVALRCEPTSLHDVISSAIEIASPLLEERAHALLIDVSRVGLDLSADAHRLSQVFANLIGNAAKYTAPRGRIEIKARRLESRLEVRVTDNGQGLEPDQLPYLFEPFFQSPQARDRAAGGLGLGLAVVKNLVELHGGEVSAHSPGPGRGSTFVVTLKGELDDSPAGSDPSARLDGQRAKPTGQRVLLVDDNEDLVELHSLVLRREGYEIATAYDGPSALELALSFRPHIAVLDLGLPVMDGFELARRLGATADPPRLIAVSGYGQASDRERGRAAGFEVHLVKPVDAHQLLAAVRGA